MVEEQEWKSTEWSVHTAVNLVYAATLTPAHCVRLSVTSPCQMESIALRATLTRAHFLRQSVLPVTYMSFPRAAML